MGREVAMNKLFLIALGGAVGTLARYGTATVLLPLAQRTEFPWGTLVVNVTGCFMIGLLHGLFVDRWVPAEEYRLALLVGFLGGYTTFSTFGWETAELLRDGRYARAGFNVLGQNVLGIAAVFTGYALGRR